METSWNVYDYPSPPEEKVVGKTITVLVSFTVYNDEFEEKLDNEQIKSYVRENISDYIREGEMNIEDIEVE